MNEPQIEFIQHLMTEINALYTFLNEIIDQLEAIRPVLDETNSPTRDALGSLDAVIYRLKVRAR